MTSLSFKLLISTLLIVFSIELSLAESIVTITATSRSQKTFVIDHGVKEGITMGQESYFSSPNTPDDDMIEGSRRIYSRFFWHRSTLS